MEQERYEIYVKGHMGPGWSDWFDGLTVANLEDGAARISGPIPDQAALHGVLARLHALNLALIELRQVSAGDQFDEQRHDPGKGELPEHVPRVRSREP